MQTSKNQGLSKTKINGVVDVTNNLLTDLILLIQQITIACIFFCQISLILYKATLEAWLHKSMYENLPSDYTLYRNDGSMLLAINNTFI